jgi:hypothetical protein
MDTPKSKTLSNTIRFTFGLAHAVLLFFCILLIYFVKGETSVPSIYFLLMILPAISFGIGTLLNTLIQYLGCGKLNFVQIVLNSLLGPFLVSATILLLWALPFLETPVYDILPVSLSPLYQKAISQGFYIFWAGLYTQVIAAGFAQVCPT